MEKSLDGCYTRMLRMVLNISWRQHITNKELYGELPKLSDRIIEARHPKEEASKVVRACAVAASKRDREPLKKTLNLH